MIKIYHAPGTRGYRVIWLCEELGTPYRVEPVDMSPAYRSSPEWRRMNPVGKVPVMTDGELTLFESGAMLQYVLDRYGGGRLQPARGTAAHGLYLQWCWFAEATFARPLGEMVNHRRAFPGQEVPAVIDEMAGRARLCLEAVERALAANSHLLGDAFCAADIMMGYTLRSCRRLLCEPLPARVRAYWARLAARPAFAATEAADKRI
ncbi:MAG: glutathione S-transferase family protein [Gammaproteobacteria bacterium]